MFSQSEGNIEECIQSFQNNVKAKHNEKKRIIRFCQEKMRDAEHNAEKESIRKIEEYKKQEKKTYREINKKRAEM